MKRYLILSFYLFSVLLSAKAQMYDPVKCDSLILVLKQYDLRKKELHQAGYVSADTQKAILLNDILSYDDYYKNTENWLARLDELKAIATALNYQKGIGNAMAFEAIHFAGQQEYKKALELTKQTLELRQKIGDSKGIRWTCFYMGACYQWQGIYKDAMPWYMKSLKMGEAANDSVLLYYVYNALSGVYEHTGDMKLATASAEKSAAFVNTPHNKPEYCLALCFLIAYYANLKEFSKADSTLNIIKDIVVEINSFFYSSYYFNVKATVEENRGNYGAAILAYINSNAMEDSMKSFQNTPYSLYSIADNILKADKNQLAIAGINQADKYDEAVRYAKKSLDICIPANIMDIKAKDYKIISIAFEAKGNMEQAYKYFKLGNEVNDTLFNVESTKSIQGLKMQYETEKQDQQIAILKKDNRIQQQEVSRQKTVRNSFMGGLALVLMISGVAFNRYKTKQKINRQLAINLERLKHSQQQLIEQEKLASLGALTAGIAHEIKNPLNFINNFSEINIEITEDLPFAKNSEDRNKMLKDLKSNFEKITGHGIRADSIVKNMLAHSKNEVRPKELSDINEMCSEYLHISYKSVRVTYSDFRCELKPNLDPMIPHVKIIAQDFSRVLINIFTNAFHAVKEHKLINPGLSPEVSLTTRLENNIIAIYIKDNGIGMSNEVREKIFEPFYTTKPAGQGTGLGLSLSFDIIKSHNGDIEVASKPNEFTEFKITLPAT